MITDQYGRARHFFLHSPLNLNKIFLEEASRSALKEKIHTGQTRMSVLKHIGQHGEPWKAVPHKSHRTEQKYNRNHIPINNLMMT